ncbi:substrate-binding periplasmic protein [Aeromonas salmonicida]|uniref:substrate-binding periplasmic protein n=1 Tax=Aeromonas salmonicida TaxID=645 RepID=UPI0028636159|nr:transporter substrate-binding domain-containing protein [Aeromonas salmonicida]MDR7022470.1 polar amino acid transport system substrate-binding protein [Aeromonas salmonicida]
MLHSYRFIILFTLLLIVRSAHSQHRELQFCYENEDSYPWVLKNGDGLNIRLIHLLENELKLKIKLLAMPWKRCLQELSVNKVDGAFAASFVDERLQYGQFPMSSDNFPDQEKRLHLSSYSLYRLKGDIISWNGEKFTHVQDKIGTLPGFSIIKLLKKNGIIIDYGSRSPEGILRKLLLKRIQGAVLQTQRADHILMNNVDLAKYIERVPVNIEEKAYYLMLSHAFVHHNPVLADMIWSTIASLRESEEYKKSLDYF